MTLGDLRKIIDELNAEIVVLFSKRLEVTRQIARIKKAQNLPVHDPVREEIQHKMLRVLAQKYGISPVIVEEIFDLLVDYSKLNMKLEMLEDEQSLGAPLRKS